MLFLHIKYCPVLCIVLPDCTVVCPTLFAKVCRRAHVVCVKLLQVLIPCCNVDLCVRWRNLFLREYCFISLYTSSTDRNWTWLDWWIPFYTRTFHLLSLWLFHFAYNLLLVSLSLLAVFMCKIDMYWYALDKNVVTQLHHLLMHISEQFLTFFLLILVVSLQVNGIVSALRTTIH